MTYDSTTRMINIDISKISAGSLGTYTIVILLEDENGNTNKYTVVFHVYDVMVAVAAEVVVAKEVE